MTATQEDALRTNRLRFRVVSRRAARVRLSATVRRRIIAGRKTVRLRGRRARIVSLRLSPRGRRLLATCTSRRVTIVARAGRRKAHQHRSLRLDRARCPAQGQPADRALPGCAAPDAAGGEWPFYSGTLDGHREQPEEKSIDTGNVSGLGVAWRTRTPDGGVIHSTPVVVDGCVYTGTELGNVYALNADTGKVVWSQELGEGTRGSSTFEGAGIVGSPAVADGLVYVGTTTPKASVLSALDQATGKIVWKRVIDEDEGGGVDSSPVPFKGMVFQAFKGDESSNHSKPGFVIVDGSRRRGGKILVKTHTVPPEDFEAGYRGGSIINTPAYDPERKLVFAGTGNPASERQHPRTNSLLKIDADPASPTFGKILASHRGTSDSYPVPQDVDLPTCQTELQWPLGRFSCAQFDFNFLASPNLWTSSDGRQMFGGLQKSGVYTAVYTDTMERAWQATVGPPCFGCNLSSTAVDESGIYVAVSGGNLYSLNRDTGAVQWATPMTGTFRYNGLAVANGVVYSLNDAAGTLQAFDASSGAPLFAHPFMQDTDTPMHDMGNSSGVSVARNTVFATSQSENASTLFALKPDARGGGGGGGEPPPSDEPPEGGGPSSAEGIAATGPGATYYGYLTPFVIINKGGKVSYTNADAVRHNVASTQGLFGSALADTGETVPVFGTEKLEPGTYEFICEPHPGMKGQLIVR
ncbi:MAG: PQQ-binding-like beta-propeller repeat protein [Actinomycetota bacterium]|nr:PQQ-binding-like beta-propeller repeat protein [Actinomycetota bacterium]